MDIVNNLYLLIAVDIRCCSLAQKHHTAVFSVFWHVEVTHSATIPPLQVCRSPALCQAPPPHFFQPLAAVWRFSRG